MSNVLIGVVGVVVTAVIGVITNCFSPCTNISILLARSFTELNKLCIVFCISSIDFRDPVVQ